MKQPRFEIPPVIDPPLTPDLIFDCDYAHINVEMKVGRQPKNTGVEDTRVTYGCIPPRLSPPLLHPDSAADENVGGVSGKINEENAHNVAHGDGNQESDIPRSITVENPGPDAHQDVTSGSGSD